MPPYPFYSGEKFVPLHRICLTLINRYMKRIWKWSWVLLLAGLFNLTFAQEASKKHLNIIFIGNSITQGALLEKPAHEAPPVQAVLHLEKQPGVGQVKFSNQGVSGCTTVDYLPSTHTLFNRMIQAADQLADEDWATLLFSVMLGTNDSASEGTNGAPVSPMQYRQNMAQLIDTLLVRYPTCKVIVHRPIWYSPTTYNGAKYLQEGLDRLISYYPVIQALVKHYEAKAPGRVFLGDTLGFDHFKSKEELFHAEQGHAGTFYLHPNKEGAKELGELWGKAIYKVILGL